CEFRSRCPVNIYTHKQPAVTIQPRRAPHNKIRYWEPSLGAGSFCQLFVFPYRFHATLSFFYIHTPTIEFKHASSKERLHQQPCLFYPFALCFPLLEKTETILTTLLYSCNKNVVQI